MENDPVIRPFGDTRNDGAIQLSFTLPIAHSERARAAARALCTSMNLTQTNVVHMERLDDRSTFFIVYGRTSASVDLDQLVTAEPEIQEMSIEHVNKTILTKLSRKAVVIGAATGTDAHTVGLDAILNLKGFHGNHGLERYASLDVHNLGSQVSNRALVSRVRELNADVLLVSQVVTHNELHLRNLTQLIDLLEAESLRGNLIAVVGGPRISHELAIELGFDAGFGAGTLPSQVAAFIAGSIQRR